MAEPRECGRCGSIMCEGCHPAPVEYPPPAPLADADDYPPFDPEPDNPGYRHADYDTGDLGGMPDAEFYDRTS